MAIRLEDLPLSYQEKIAGKLLREQRAKLQREQKSQKYHSCQTEERNIKFSSRAEQRRYRELVLLFRSGEIQDLRIHPQFTLLEGYTKPDGQKVQRMRYTADFSYMQEGQLVVEDVKSRPTRTTDYKMRKKMMLDKYGIEIREVSG